jgi:hypothetical protein
MYRLRGFLKAHRVQAHQGDCTQQRNAGAVDLQKRQFAQDHAQVDNEEDRYDRCRHD